MDLITIFRHFFKEHRDNKGLLALWLLADTTKSKLHNYVEAIYVAKWRDGHDHNIPTLSKKHGENKVVKS